MCLVITEALQKQFISRCSCFVETIRLSKFVTNYKQNRAFVFAKLCENICKLNSFKNNIFYLIIFFKNNHCFENMIRGRIVNYLECKNKSPSMEKNQFLLNQKINDKRKVWGRWYSGQFC